MNCPLCGKEVKAIAINSEACVFCDTEQAEIITMSGHIFKGYMRHECDGKEKKERNSVSRR